MMAALLDLPGALGAVLVTLQAKAVLVLVCAWAVARVFRRASAAVRHAIWATSLVGVVGLPLADAILPAQTIAVPSWTTRLGIEGARQELRAAGTPLAPGAIAAIDPLPAAPPSSAPAAVTTRVAAKDRSVSWLYVLSALWLVIALLRLCWLGVQLGRVRMLGGARLSVADASLQVEADGLGRQLGLRRGVRVRVSERVTMPCTSGVWRPLVLLPADAGSWTQARLRVVLLHELAHVRRYDYAAWLLAEFACALYWVNPLVWVARRRVQVEQEQACDDEVLGHGVGSVEYAQHLLDVARALYGRRWAWGATLSFAREISLKRRVRAILDHRRDRQPRATFAGALGILLVSACVLSISVLRAAAQRPANDDLAAVRADDGVAGGTTSMLERHVPAPAVAPVPRAAPPAVRSETRVHAVRARIVDDASYAWLEAEAGVLRGAFHVAADTRASGNAHVRAAGGSAGELRLGVRVDQAGAYYVWARVRVGGRDANSLGVSLGDRDIEWHVQSRRSDERGVWRWERVEHDGSTVRIDLTAGTHEIAVRARDAGVDLDGLLITTDARFRPHGAAPVLPPAEVVQVWIEAEDAETTAPFATARDRRAAGGRYLRVTGRDNSRSAPPSVGTATFRVSVPSAGQYLLWARTRIDDRAEDSFWVRANEAAWIAWNGIDADKVWEWSTVRDAGAEQATALLDLHAGENTITFAYRESGARLDRLLLTNDPRLAPHREARSQRANRP